MKDREHLNKMARIYYHIRKAKETPEHKARRLANNRLTYKLRTIMDEVIKKSGEHFNVTFKTDFKSSNIKAYAYDSTKHSLYVYFRSKILDSLSKIYEYRHVPLHIYQGLEAAESKGVYFSANIRNKYNYKVHEK